MATALSARTRDANTMKACNALFAKYSTPQKLARAPLRDVEKLIHPVGMYKTKAKNIIEAIAKVRDLKEEYYERAEKMLMKIQWEFPAFLHIYKFPEEYRYFITSEGMITHYIEGSSRYGSGGRLEKPISWFQLLDVLSPAMFLHKVEIKVEEDLFRYEEDVAGEGKKKLYIIACDSEYYLW